MEYAGRSPRHARRLAQRAADALDPLCGARRRLPVRDRRIAGVARTGDIVFRHQRIGQVALTRTSPAASSAPAAHCLPGCAAAPRVPSPHTQAARLASGSACTRANSARRRPSSSCRRQQQPLRIDVALHAPAIALIPAATSIQIVPPVDPQALQVHVAQRRPVRRSGVARVIDQRRLRAALAELPHHRGQCRAARRANCSSGKRTGGRVKDCHGNRRRPRPAAPCWRPAGHISAR
jgi:hypothetical protein